MLGIARSVASGTHSRYRCSPQMTRSCSLLRIAMVFLLSSAPAFAQNTLSVHWEELTGPDFISAVHQAQGLCVLPFGIIEKHGPHLPLGTDLINVRYLSEKAAQ